jgi:REP element-mobilizing transposase RayT
MIRIFDIEIDPKRFAEEHFVFTCKCRKDFFELPQVDGMIGPIFETISTEIGCPIKAMATDPEKPDHLHLFIGRPKTMTEAKLAQRFKGASSRELRKKIPLLKGMERKAFWGRRYWSEPVGHLDAAKLIKYMQNQGHKKREAEPLKIAAKPVPQRRLL